MCGFVGFTGKLANRDTVLTGMMDAIVHRGPDSAGTHLDERIAMGFRRLSIIDLEHGHQPMFNEDKSLVLTFNGEIYNFRALQQELAEKGHNFSTDCDSEVLIHAYEEYGVEMLQKLRGMFAFVIWDVREDTLFAARDFFGIKPFYYTQVQSEDGPGLIYGSEIKSFLHHPQFKKELNPSALKPYLSFQYSVLDETFFKGVYKLPPAHYMLFKQGEIKIQRYWEINFQSDGKDIDYYIDQIEESVRDSVAAHRISDVKVGSFLSGGVDSSYITASLMPNKTFSVGFHNDNFDETMYAKELSERLGVENHQQLLDPDQCFEKLAEIQYHMDEPQSNPSSVPLYFLSQLASEHVTVVLSGEGADELFGGYKWYDTPDLLKKYRKLPRSFRIGVGKLAKLTPQWKGKNFLVKGGSDVEDYFIGQANVFSEEEADSLLKEEYTAAPSLKEITGPVYAKVQGKDDVTKMQYLDLHLWLAGDILLKADKMSMAHSLELRVPFLDKEVMAIAGRIPAKYNINQINTKYALRKAANRILPDEWADRTKVGFPVPIRLWLREKKYYQQVKAVFSSDYAAQFFDTSKLLDILETHYRSKKDYGRKIWTVYVFLVWYNKFFIELS